MPGKFHRERNLVGHSPWDQVPKSWTWLSDSVRIHHLLVPKFIRLRWGRRVMWRWWGGGMNNQRFLLSRTPPGSRLEKGVSYLSAWSTMTVENPREPQIQKQSAPLITFLPEPLLNIGKKYLRREAPFSHSPCVVQAHDLPTLKGEVASPLETMKTTKHRLFLREARQTSWLRPGHFSGTREMFIDGCVTGDPSASDPSLTASKRYPPLMEGWETHHPSWALCREAVRFCHHSEGAGNTCARNSAQSESLLLGPLEGGAENLPAFQTQKSRDAERIQLPRIRDTDPGSYQGRGSKESFLPEPCEYTVITAAVYHWERSQKHRRKPLCGAEVQGTTKSKAGHNST